MRILVFGKTGQVATELQRQAPVTALGRDQADLSNPQVCADIIATTDANIIINAAAYTAVDKAEDDVQLANVVNGDAPGAMALAAAARGIPFLHISTDYVFNGSGTQARKPNDAVDPLGVYGRSKLLGEERVQSAGGSYAVLRTSWVFSAHGANFVKSMLRLGADRDALSIVSDQIGGPTPAADIAATLLRMAGAFAGGTGKAGTYHYAGTPAVSWADFAREIFTQSGLNVRVNDIPSSDYPTPAKRPLNSRLDGSTLAADYGINPPDWKTGLRKVLTELGQVS